MMRFVVGKESAHIVSIEQDGDNVNILLGGVVVATFNAREDEFFIHRKELRYQFGTTTTLYGSD